MWAALLIYACSLSKGHHHAPTCHPSCFGLGGGRPVGGALPPVAHGGRRLAPASTHHHDCVGNDHDDHRRAGPVDDIDDDIDDVDDIDDIDDDATGRDVHVDCSGEGRALRGPIARQRR